MMKTLEIIYGNSCYQTLLQSKFDKRQLLKFNILLNIGDISKIKNGEIIIPKSLRYEKSYYNCKNELKIIRQAFSICNKVRVWTSHYNIYTQLLLLLICDVAHQHHRQLSVVYSDEFKPSYISPSLMSAKELNELAKQEHILTADEITNNALIWQNLIQTNSPMRVLNDKIIKSVAIDYYDEIILMTLSRMGRCRVSKLVGQLMAKVYLADNQFVFLIKKLIDDQKIKIITNDLRFFDCIIEKI